MPGKVVLGHAVKAYRWSRCIPPLILCLFVCLFLVRPPQWARASSFTRFLDHTQRRTTVGRTPLDESLSRRRDLYLTTHNSQNGQTSMLPVGFEPTVSSGELPQTYALDREAAGIGPLILYFGFIRKREVRFTPRPLYPRQKKPNRL